MPTVPNFTAKAWGVDAILGGKLEEFVTSRRAQGRAWRHIATDLFEATDRKVDVTAETLRQWFPDDRESGAGDQAASDPEPNGDQAPETKAS